MSVPFCSGEQPHNRAELHTSFTDLFDNQSPLQSSTDHHRSPHAHTHCIMSPNATRCECTNYFQP